MIIFKWYRWFRAAFGARSFVKVNDKNVTCAYLLVSGASPTLIEDLTRQGFTEEWAIDDQKENSDDHDA